MSDTGMAIIGMLKERLHLVQELSRLTARRLLNQQIAGGADFAIMQLEYETAAGEGAQARTAALQEEVHRRDEARRAMAADDEAVAELERQLEELDRRITAGRQ